MKTKGVVCRVTVAKEIQDLVAGMDAGKRRELATRFRLFARQLEFSARILEIDSVPRAPRLKRYPRWKLVKN